MVNHYQQLPTIRIPASLAGGIKTDAGEQTDAERQAKKRLGVESAEHRTPIPQTNPAAIMRQKGKMRETITINTYKP